MTNYLEQLGAATKGFTATLANGSGYQNINTFDQNTLSLDNHCQQRYVYDQQKRERCDEAPQELGLSTNLQKAVWANRMGGGNDNSIQNVSWDEFLGLKPPDFTKSSKYKQASSSKEPQPEEVSTVSTAPDQSQHSSRTSDQNTFTLRKHSTSVNEYGIKFNTSHFASFSRDQQCLLVRESTQLRAVTLSVEELNAPVDSMLKAACGISRKRSFTQQPKRKVWVQSLYCRHCKKPCFTVDPSKLENHVKLSQKCQICGLSVHQQCDNEASNNYFTRYSSSSSMCTNCAAQPSSSTQKHLKSSSTPTKKEILSNCGSTLSDTHSGQAEKVSLPSSTVPTSTFPTPVKAAEIPLERSPFSSFQCENSSIAKVKLEASAEPVQASNHKTVSSTSAQPIPAPNIQQQTQRNDSPPLQAKSAVLGKRGRAGSANTTNHSTAQPNGRVLRNNANTPNNKLTIRTNGDLSTSTISNNGSSSDDSHQSDNDDDNTTRTIRSIAKQNHVKPKAQKLAPPKPNKRVPANAAKDTDKPEQATPPPTPTNALPSRRSSMANGQAGASTGNSKPSDTNGVDKSRGFSEGGQCNSKASAISTRNTRDVVNNGQSGGQSKGVGVSEKNHLANGVREKVEVKRKGSGIAGKSRGKSGEGSKKSSTNHVKSGGGKDENNGKAANSQSAGNKATKAGNETQKLGKGESVSGASDGKANSEKYDEDGKVGSQRDEDKQGVDTSDSQNGEQSGSDGSGSSSSGDESNNSSSKGKQNSSNSKNNNVISASTVKRKGMDDSDIAAELQRQLNGLRSRPQRSGSLRTGISAQGTLECGSTQ